MKDYQDYIIEKAHTDKYDLFVLCLHHESFINYLDDLKKDPLLQNSKGKILIDQLLVTGNGKNRYILLDYDNGELDLDSAVLEEPDPTYRDKAVEVLKDYSHLLDNTILTDLEKENINNQISF